MAFNGSGTFVRLYSWVTDRNNSTKIVADRHDAEDDGFATGLSMCLLKDGQQTPTANIPWGGFRLTGLGNAAAGTDALNRDTGDGRYHPKGSVTTTDNAVARYDGTAGVTQNSGVLIDDSNNLTVPASVIAQSTDAGASDYSGVIVDRFSASPAASDVLGSYVLRGRDSGGNSTDYASIRGVILDPTNTSEDGQVILNTLVGGSATAIMTWGPGVQIGAPTGGDKGAGTLNVASGYYVNNVAVPTISSTDTQTNKTFTSPVINTGDINGGTADALTSLGIRSTGAAFDLQLVSTEVLTGNKTLTIDLDDTNRTVRLQTDLNLTSAGAALIDDADTTAQKATLGLANSSTDNAIVRFDSTAGNTQNSGVTIDDSDVVSGVTGLTIATTAAGTPLISRSTESGATTFAGLLVDRNSSTPAANDFIGKVQFRGRDNAAGATTYAEIDSQILDTTDTSEDGRMILRTMVAGTSTDIVTLGPGVQIGAPTGGDKGAATLNATQLYVAGTAAYATGTFTPTVTLAGGAGNTTPVYSTNTGRYTQIFNQVLVDVLLSGDGGDEGAGSGTVTIALPVAAHASHSGDRFVAGSAQNGTSEYMLFGQISGGASTVSLQFLDTAATADSPNFTGALQNNTSRVIRLKFFYEV
jgi:hypothetical protein